MYCLHVRAGCTENLLAYDDVDADVLQCYHEMTLANLLYHAMKEGACSEQSSRMTAMDAASKNASESCWQRQGVPVSVPLPILQRT